MKIKLTLFIVALFAYVNVAIGQSKISINVENSSAESDTFYFQKRGSNALNLSFSENVKSLFIGKQSGTSNLGFENIGIGNGSLKTIGGGSYNIAIGFEASLQATGTSGNIAIGQGALKTTMTASNNIAIGRFSLNENTSGSSNTSLGSSSMTGNTTGQRNVGIGSTSLRWNKTGEGNTAVGEAAMEGVFQNSHSFNTAVGYRSMQKIATGFGNTVLGVQALQNNDDGSDNVAVGLNSLVTSNGSDNVVVGASAFSNHTMGNGNVVIGKSAGANNMNGFGNVFIGNSAGSSEMGSSKLYIANDASTTPLLYGEFDNKRLRVNGNLMNVEGTAGSFEINDGSDLMTFDGDEINTDGNMFLNFRSSGNVQLGNSTSDATHTAGGQVFEISHDNSPTLRMTRNNSGSGGFFDYEMYMSGANLTFRGGANGSGNTLKDYVTFHNSGNVGIGIINPSYDLDIKGRDGNLNLLRVQNEDNTDVLKITGGLNPQAEMFGYWDISSPEIGTGYPDITEAIVVNSSFKMNSLGQIRVGNPGGGSTPQSDIHIKQSFFVPGEASYSPGIRLENNSNINYWNTYIDGANDYNFAFNNSLKSYIKDTDGVYVVSSDRRLKNNIRNLGAVLPSLMKLSPTQYSFKSDRTNQISTGFIAQDVQKIFPEFVSEKEGILRIGYDYFIPVAIKGIQELSSENDQLRKELDDLKAEMAEIKALLEKSR